MGAFLGLNPGKSCPRTWAPAPARSPTPWSRPDSGVGAVAGAPPVLCRPSATVHQPHSWGCRMGTVLSHPQCRAERGRGDPGVNSGGMPATAAGWGPRLTPNTQALPGRAGETGCAQCMSVAGCAANVLTATRAWLGTRMWGTHRASVGGEIQPCRALWGWGQPCHQSGDTS